MAHQIDPRKAWDRVVVVRPGADRDLRLHQGPWLERRPAQGQQLVPLFGQPAVDRRRTDPHQQGRLRIGQVEQVIVAPAAPPNTSPPSTSTPPVTPPGLFTMPPGQLHQPGQLHHFIQDPALTGPKSGPIRECFVLRHSLPLRHCQLHRNGRDPYPTPESHTTPKRRTSSETTNTTTRRFPMSQLDRLIRCGRELILGIGTDHHCNPGSYAAL